MSVNKTTTLQGLSATNFIFEGLTLFICERLILFMYCILNGAVSVSGNITSNVSLYVSNELERIWKEEVWPNYTLPQCLSGRADKKHKNLSQDIWSTS
jgi:hypothetical protein